MRGILDWYTASAEKNQTWVNRLLNISLTILKCVPPLPFCIVLCFLSWQSDQKVIYVPFKPLNARLKLGPVQVCMHVCVRFTCRCVCLNDWEKERLSVIGGGNIHYGAEALADKLNNWGERRWFLFVIRELQKKRKQSTEIVFVGAG